MNLEGVSVLDLFGGTGNISLEFLSRGAAELCYVEENIRCLKFFSDECKKLALTTVKFHKGDVFSFLKNCSQSFEIIFADPPYDKGLAEKIPQAVFQKNLLQKNGLLIVEHSEKLNLSLEQHFQEKRKYGNVCFSFFSVSETSVQQ